MHKENEPFISELGCLTGHLTHAPSSVAQLPTGVPISINANSILLVAPATKSSLTLLFHSLQSKGKF